MLHSDSERTPSSIVEHHRGVYGILQEGMELPVGGSIFTSKLTSKIRLDFQSFPKFIDEKSLDEVFEAKKEAYLSWFKQLPQVFQDAIDPRTYFALTLIQKGMEERLSIVQNTDSSVQKNQELLQSTRVSKYIDATPTLSDFKDGTSMCAERAALGQWMLQSVGIPSAYMSGVSFYADISDWSDHSWIVLYPGTEKSIIFDIARPEQHSLPNVYKSEGPFSHSLFIDENNAFVKTNKLLRNSIRYFWVSDHSYSMDEPVMIISSRVNQVLSSAL